MKMEFYNLWYQLSPTMLQVKSLLYVPFFFSPGFHYHYCISIVYSYFIHSIVVTYGDSIYHIANMLLQSRLSSAHEIRIPLFLWLYC